MTHLADVWHQRGRALQLSNQLVMARQAYEEALRHNPSQIKTLNNLGVLRRYQGDWREAQYYLEQGLHEVSKAWKETDLNNNTRRHQLVEDWSRLFNSFAQLALDQGQTVHAREYAKTAFLLDPQSVACIALGVALDAEGRNRPAERCHRLGLMRYGLDEKHPERLVGLSLKDPISSAQLHKQLCNLATSRLHSEPLSTQHWQLLLARLGTSVKVWSEATNPWERIWRGEPIQRLLIWDEQGFGDAMQCLRWIHLACNHAKEVVVVVRPCLLRLVKERLSLPPHCRMQAMPAAGPPLGSFERHCPLMALPVALYSSQTSIQTGGEQPQPFIQSQWQSRVYPEGLRGQRQKRLGLVWEAGQKEDADAQRAARLRSIPLITLMRHALRWRQHWDLELLSLQLGPGQKSIDTWLGKGLISQLPSGGDWEDTAQTVEQLDLVVSVDTAMVHLAGNLNVPCLVLLNASHDWRWGSPGSAVTWYQNQEVLRCRNQNGWDALLEEADSSIDALLNR